MHSLNILKVVRHDSADAFLCECANWLSQNEDLNHGLLSLADALRSERHIHSPPFVFCHVYGEEEILGAAIFAEPDGLVLSEMTSEASAAFFPYLYDVIGLPSRIFGPAAPAMTLAEHFADISNTSLRVHSEWLVHRLDKALAHEIQVPGRVTLGAKGDRQLVSKWGREYDAEKPANVNIEEFLLRKLEDELLLFWTDVEPKSLITLSGQRCTGQRISSVFTPREFRGNGYAFALVYNLGCHKLASGKAYMTLNTEVGEPVEQMYKKIGYRTIGKKVSIVFA
jgi:hypothetical protein